MIHFDTNRNAIINPGSYDGIKYFPERCLFVYEDDYFRRMKRRDTLERLMDRDGQPVPDLYVYDKRGKNILVVNPPDSAPTSAILMERIIASGAQYFVAVGTCGTLDRNIAPHQLVVPTSAIREEGTSYHYYPDAPEIAQDSRAVNHLKRILRFYKLDFAEGKIWSTDAIYRETKAKVKKMAEQGAIAVDMECSALCAISRFRHVKFVEFLIAMDNLDAEVHEPRLDEYDRRYDDRIISAALDTLIRL